MDSVTLSNDIAAPLENRELLARSLAGDRASREELARACLARVRRTVFLSVRGAADADDVVQTAMSRIFAGLPEFRADAKLTTWIDRVTVNAVRDHFRRKPILAALLFAEPCELAPAPESFAPDAGWERRRLADALRGHLQKIRPNKRIALMLSVAYGYSAGEIAAMTDCTVETAKKRLQHGRRELMSRVRKDPYLFSVLEERGTCRT
ncbi:MAG: RNA polymerase sigma factor [Proteobacteria bacterium]|jgi:RNA polymerase sigma-70 factor (ECF subfamily)|nr:RNA polymerase sigma factor [Pseudomonadota bacterium]